MKRSEMRDIIDRAIKRWNGAYYDEDLASYVLSEIEEAGMLPPLDSLGEREFNRSDIAATHITKVFNHLRWENEDNK